MLQKSLTVSGVDDDDGGNIGDKGDILWSDPLEEELLLIWQIGDSLATSFSIVIDPNRYESRDDDDVAQNSDGWREKKELQWEMVEVLSNCGLFGKAAQLSHLDGNVCALFCNHLKTATAPRILTSWSVEKGKLFKSKYVSSIIIYAHKILFEPNYNLNLI